MINSINLSEILLKNPVFNVIIFIEKVARGDSNMINTYEYYQKNINQNSFYYFTFNNDIETYFVFNEDFKYYDEKELINRFKVLTYPSNDYPEPVNMEFIMICFYLNNENYYIEQFPNFLERPTNVVDFSLEIREYILAQGNSPGEVAWATRRNVANNLKFSKKDNTNIKVSDNLNQLFKKISNRNADFILMSEDEKLEEINNVIENILKINNKWADIDYKNESFDFISNDSVIKYRKLIHCFRHGSEDSIKEREKISKNQKEFLINYGITICELLLNAIRNKNES